MGTVTQAPFSVSSLFEVLALCQRIQPDGPWKTRVSKVRKEIDVGNGALDTSVVIVLKSLDAGEVDSG